MSLESNPIDESHKIGQKCRNMRNSFHQGQQGTLINLETEEQDWQAQNILPNYLPLTTILSLIAMERLSRLFDGGGGGGFGIDFVS